MKFVFSILLMTLLFANVSWSQVELRRLDTIPKGTKITWRSPLLIRPNTDKVPLLGLIDVKGVGSNIYPVYKTFLDEFRPPEVIVGIIADEINDTYSASGEHHKETGCWFYNHQVDPSNNQTISTLIVDHADYTLDKYVLDTQFIVGKTTYTIYFTSRDKISCSRLKASGSMSDQYLLSPMYFDDFVAATSSIFSSIIEP